MKTINLKEIFSCKKSTENSFYQPESLVAKRRMIIYPADNIQLLRS